MLSILYLPSRHCYCVSHSPSARAVGASRCGVSATAAIMAEAEKRYAEGTLVEVTELTEMSGGY